MAWGSPECEAQVQEAPEASESWRCFYLWARRTGSWDGAVARLEGALREDPSNAHAMLNLGHIAMATGQSADDGYTRALATYEEKGDLAGVVKAHVALAQWRSMGASPAEVVYGHLDAADQAAQAAGGGLLQAIVDAQRARRMWRDGSNYAEAYRLIRRAEVHAFPDGPYQLRLVVLHVLAGVCQETGRLDEAAVASQRMVALTEEAGDRYVEATARLNVAAFALMNPDRASPGTAEKESALALTAAEDVGNPWVVAGAQCVRAEALEASGGDSLPHWLACRDRYRELGEPGMGISGALGAAVALADTEPERALELSAEAVQTAQQTSDVWAEVLARFVEAALVWEVRGFEAGVAAFAEHEAASEALLQAQADADTRAAVLANQVDGHHYLAARLARRGTAHIDGAIAAIERLRARELRTALLEGQVLPEPEPATAARLHELAQQITALNTRLGEAESSEQRQQMTLEKEALVAEESRLRDALLDPDLSAPPPTLQALQAELEDGEVLVAFQTPPVLSQYPRLGAQPWALAVTREAVGVVPLPERRSLESLVLTFAGLYEDEGAGEVARGRAGAAVHQQLLAPALASVGRRELPDRLVVIPDGPLHGLPFSALYAGDAMLGAELRLSRGASLTTWLAQRRGTTRATGEPLVLGAPTWPRAGGEALAELPVAAEEARAVARALGVEAAIGDDAQEAVLHRSGSAPALVHVAAHGREEGDAARRHALVLAEGGGEDGLLEAREARLLDLQGSVVVLSACRGAAGQVREGDGLDGLSRAFLLAGAPVVVGSLWPVRDDAAGAFFEDFTGAMVEGASVDEALRRARRRRQEAGDPASAWAGMVAIGDGRRTLAPEALEAGGCGGGLGMVAMVGGLLGRRRRRAREEQGGG